MVFYNVHKKIISTSNKNKFKYVGRKTYLAKIDSLSAPVNVELTMQMSIINDNLFEMIPPYGDNSTICKSSDPFLNHDPATSIGLDEKIVS